MDAVRGFAVAGRCQGTVAREGLDALAGPRMMHARKAQSERVRKTFDAFWQRSRRDAAHPMLGGCIGAIGGQKKPAEEEGLHSQTLRPAFPGVCAEAGGGAEAFRGRA